MKEKDKKRKGKKGSDKLRNNRRINTRNEA
jgi:hypothetical protein